MSDAEYDLERFPRLPPRELHVWRVDLDCPPAAWGLSAECLSAEERGRAERFVRPLDGQRFIVAHAAVRVILGRYLGVPPGLVEIAVRAGGKPEVVPSSGRPPLNYNLSHSEGLAIVGCVLGQEIGVDVERVRPFVDVENIVARYFAAGEQETWRSLPEEERLAAFFRGWTRKEAYLKARGIGLSAGLDRFEVSLAAGEPARLLRGDGPQDAGDRWQIYGVSAGDGYMAACVVEGGVDRLFVYPPVRQ
jgi:4'-phosphopantetheinyl transferase